METNDCDSFRLDYIFNLQSWKASHDSSKIEWPVSGISISELPKQPISCCISFGSAVLYMNCPDGIWQTLAYKYFTCVVSIMILARWSAVLWMPMCGRARGDGDAVVQQQAKAHKVAGTRFLSRGPAPPVLPPDFPQQPARSGLIPTTCVPPPPPCVVPSGK